jgi:sugar phosphate isomerase/epimerase
VTAPTASHPPPASPPSPRALAIASAALPGLDAERLCEAAAGEGLAGVEWGVGAGHPLSLEVSPHAAERLVRATTMSGLHCSGLAVHAENALALPLVNWHRLAEAAVTARAPHVRVYAPAPSGVFSDDFGRLRRLVSERAAIVAAVGLRLLIEPAPSTLVPGPALAVDALSDADPDQVGVVFDPGSLAREGWLDPFLAVGVLGSFLRHVHIKNTAPVRDEDGVWRWRRAGLDTGIVDWSQVLSALTARDYGGWLVLDHLSSHADDSLPADLADLRRLLAEAGAS